jgi:hypothetical protein
MQLDESQPAREVFADYIHHVVDHDIDHENQPKQELVACETALSWSPYQAAVSDPFCHEGRRKRNKRVRCPALLTLTPRIDFQQWGKSVNPAITEAQGSLWFD